MRSRTCQGIWGSRQYSAGLLSGRPIMREKYLNKAGNDTSMKGIYCLMVYLSNQQNISFGRHLSEFKKGHYLYVGSALNGLLPRISRHLKKKKKIYWHIDNLLANRYAKISKIYYLQTGKKIECTVAGILGKNLYPIDNFGCSDCRCSSHLFYTGSSNNRDHEYILLGELGFKSLENYEVKKLVKK